jgi:hypothetical protein
VPHKMKFLACLVTLLCTAATWAQSETSASTSSPVAYVYVSRPTHVDAFAASSTGKLTPVASSPFSNISVYPMSVTKKFLFGAGDDHKTIYTYSIASNGALKQVASIDATKYSTEGDADCCFGPLTLDYTGSTLYNYTINGGEGSWLETFRIESNGELQFLGNTETDGGFDIQEVAPTMVSFLGNNQYAYQTGCDQDVLTDSATAGFKRESSGLLEPLGAMRELPKAKSGDIYCPVGLVADPSDHLAMAMQAWNVDQGQPDGPNVLASYTADSHGNISTKSTIANMPSVAAGIGVMSISPSGKLLAIGAGGGFQVFHFNGSDPITKYTGLLHTSENFVEFGWDKDNHLYALSTTNLHVYSATSTSLKEVSGSPYSIPEASSVIVLSLN